MPARHARTRCADDPLAGTRLGHRVQRRTSRVSAVARVAGSRTRRVSVTGCNPHRSRPGRRRSPHPRMLTARPSITPASRARCRGGWRSAGSSWRACCRGCAMAGPGRSGSSPVQLRVREWVARPRHCGSPSSGRCGGSCAAVGGPGCCSRLVVSSSERSNGPCVSAPGAGGCSLPRATDACGAGCRQRARIGLGTVAWPARSPHGGHELLASARLKSQITFSVACRRDPAELCSGFRVYSAGDDHAPPVKWLAGMRPGGRG